MTKLVNLTLDLNFGLRRPQMLIAMYLYEFPGVRKVLSDDQDLGRSLLPLKRLNVTDRHAQKEYVTTCHFPRMLALARFPLCLVGRAAKKYIAFLCVCACICLHLPPQHWSPTNLPSTRSRSPLKLLWLTSKLLLRSPSTRIMHLTHLAQSVCFAQPGHCAVHAFHAVCSRCTVHSSHRLMKLTKLGAIGTAMIDTHAHTQTPRRCITSFMLHALCRR